MKLKFIGTGSGNTSLKRFHSSFLIRADDYNLLVDAGDGISKGLMTAGVDINAIHALLFTHMHPDHSAGFPSYIVQLKLMKREEKLVVYCHDYHKENLLALLNYTHIYPDRLPFILEFRTFSEGTITDTGKGIKFKALANAHLDDIRESYPDKNIISCGFLFYLNRKKLFYTGDIGNEDDLYLFGKEKVDVFIAEYTHIEENKIIKAFNSSGAEHLYLTHIPDEEEKPMEAENGVIYVYDGYEFMI